jgi:haloalkane dehalogenase
VPRLVPDGAITLVVHDYGGPIALDWALDHPDRLRHLVVVNSWMWPFDDDPTMRRRAALAGGALGRFLYRRFNASQRLIMPSAYGDRRRLTPAIHRQYLEVFPDADSRERVLFALAQALLGSGAFYRGLWERRHRLAGVPLTVIWGMRDSAFQPPILDRWLATFPHARPVRIAEAGHWPHEEAPEAVVDALRRVLAGGS